MTQWLILDNLPPNTWLTITADHGSCLVRTVLWSRPYPARKVLEVPFVEGLVT